MEDLLAIPAPWFLVLGAALAGLVRGFSGFGTAMVFMPFAAQVLPPVWVLVSMMIMDLIGPIPALPRVFKDGDPGDVLRLGAGALVGIPIGLSLLLSMDPLTFRYAVSALTCVMLLLLVSGRRYRGPVGKPMIYGTGGISGFLSGSVGLGGPPVILFYMMRPLSPAVIRANTMLFLVLIGVMTLSLFALRGLVDAAPLLLGAVLTPFYLAALWLGARLFDPMRERVYRWVGYVIIAGAALSGLPLWD